MLHNIPEQQAIKTQYINGEFIFYGLQTKQMYVDTKLSITVDIT